MDVKKLIILCLVFATLVGCSSDKSYSDFTDENFDKIHEENSNDNQSKTNSSNSSSLYEGYINNTYNCPSPEANKINDIVLSCDHNRFNFEKNNTYNLNIALFNNEKGPILAEDLSIKCSSNFNDNFELINKKPKQVIESNTFEVIPIQIQMKDYGRQGKYQCKFQLSNGDYKVVNIRMSK